MMKELEDKYIGLLLKRCINFLQSNSLLIHIDLKEHLNFARRVEQKARYMGVKDVYIHVEDLDDIHDYLASVDVGDIAKDNFIDRSVWDLYAKRGGACLFLNSPVPKVMNNIDAGKINEWVLKRNKTSPYYRENVGKYLFPWCIATLPNERWASVVFPNDIDAYDKLYMNILKMCMVDKEDPIKAWQEWIDENNYYKSILNELEITRMHYLNSSGTDLYVYKPKNSIWLNLDKIDACGNKVIANMPSYEIFTTPDYRKTEGIVYSSRPLIYNGCRIDDFYIEFKHGRAINCNAASGNKALESLVFSDQYTGCLGEVALVPNDSPISNTNLIFYETLFDENASCHLALGRGFHKTIPDYYKMSDEELYNNGLNLGNIHTDFMIGTSDLSIEADTNKGKVLVFKDGNFNI